MPSYVVKPTPDSDVYVHWSDITESPIAWGGRDFMWRHLTAAADRPYGDKSDPAERLARADRMGTSALWPTPEDPAYRWGEGFIYQQQGWLPRARLLDLCERLSGDEDADVSDLLEPFDE